MSNHRTKEKIAALRAEKKHFHGSCCNTSFANKSPANKRKSAWRGARPKRETNE